MVTRRHKSDTSVWMAGSVAQSWAELLALNPFGGIMAGIVRRRGASFRREHVLTPDQHQVLDAIERCKTASLGGDVELCLDCDHRRIAYNSCRNRHCPKC